ncbi:hypothetical protein PSPO01_09207 [Paraphaeosphaeria sporulosa]
MMKIDIPAWPLPVVRVTSALLVAADYQSMSLRLDGVADRLFKKDGTVQVMACRWSKHQKFENLPLRSYEDLCAYVIIDQEHTRSSLDITHNAMKVLLSSFSAFPQLANALPEFAASDIPIQGSRTFFHTECSISRLEGSSDHLCMLLKYIEPNRNFSDPIPWSIRQQLLHQSIDACTLREHCVVIRPSEAFKASIIDQFMQRGNVSTHWTNLPVVLVGSLNAHWSAYVRFLDKEIWDIDKSIDFTNPFSETPGEANFRSLPRTKQYHDLLIRARHALKANIHVLRLLLKESIKRLTLESKASRELFADHYTTLDSIVNDVIEESCDLVEYLETLKLRVDRITEAIRDSIALRNTHHAAVESQNMKRLTVKSVQEARTVKAIALVTLVYLPATFIATFLGINGINIQQTDTGVLHIEADAQVILYFALTVPLTSVTLLLWWAWEKWSRLRRGETGSMDPQPARPWKAHVSPV